MNASSAVLAAARQEPSSQAKTTKQATTSARVTTGVCRVGLASRRGITGPLRSGLLGRLRAGLRLARRWARRTGRRAGRRRRVRDGHEDRLVDAVLATSRRASRAGLRRRGRRTSPRRSVQSGASPARRYWPWYVPFDLGQGDDPRVGSVEAVDRRPRDGPVAGRDERVARRRPQERCPWVAWRPSPRSCRRRSGAIAPSSAAKTSPSTYVEVIFDDVPRGGQPGGRLGREAAAVGGRRVGPDLLLGRVDDVEVVQAARARVRRNVLMPDDVVAERGGALDRDPGERALARRRRPGASATGRSWRRGSAGPGRRRPGSAASRRSRSLVFVAGPGDERRLLGLEVDPVDGLGRPVDDVRGAVRAADHRAQVEGRRLGRRLEREDPASRRRARPRTAGPGRPRPASGAGAMTDGADPGRLRRSGAGRGRRSGARGPGPGRRSTRSIPGPVTLARSARAWSSAFWPALTELMACCGVLPPKA